MNALAKKNIFESQTNKSKIKIIDSDIKKLELNKEFDLVFSLFHVACYFYTDKCLHSFFKTASKHLKRDCLFIFDYWFGPAVLHQKPSKRKKIIKNGNDYIERDCESLLNTNNSTVTVITKSNFYLTRKNISNQSVRLTL